MQAIEEGIKIVGVGKKGSKSLTADLAHKILVDIRANQVSALQQGAFFAGLLMKGAAETEEALLEDFSLERLIEDAPESIQKICHQLINGENLDVSTAYALGSFLFSKEEGNGARGLVTSLLRVRYETQDEYEGLLKAIEDTFEAPFQAPIPNGRPVIQIAEPFDGVDHSYLNTPLLGDFLSTKDFRVLHLVGRNSGPKYGNNLFDLAKGLNEPFIKGSEDFIDAKSYFLDQGDLSSALDQWVDYRRALIKRPFLATLERFVNPLKADILIASAFHSPYGDKMIAISECAGVRACIIVRNGLEGTCNFPLLRSTKVLASIKRAEGYKRKEFIFMPPQKFKVEEKLTDPSLEENVRLIQAYRKEGKTDNEHFDVRISYMRSCINDVLEWMEDSK